ncbi:MAG TPA: TonB-dependent receptor [Opitutaceae bacterium]
MKTATRESLRFVLCLAAALALLALFLASVRAEPFVLEGDVVALDKFEVTGEKLGRTLQETQSSVAAYTGEELTRTTDTSLFDVFQRTANTFAVDGGFSIRGIPNDGFAGLDGSPLATVVVDGANLDNKMVADGALAVWDLEQIEILRGPQSTSQGRNSLAGAIVARTRNPTFSRDGQARATYASDNTYQTALAFGGPLVEDWLAFRVAVDRQYSDGSITNLTRNEDDWDRTDLLTFRGKLLFQPAKWQGFSALATYSQTENDSNTRGYSYGDTDAELYQRRSYENTPNDFTSTSRLGSLELNQEFANGWVLTSTTAGTRLKTDSAYDGDRTPTQSLVYGFSYDNRSFNEELRLLAKGSTWKAVAGLYYADERLGYGSSGPFYYIVSPALPRVLLSADTNYKTDIETQAVFLNGDWQPTQRWTLTAGLRLETETIDLDSRQDVLVLEGFTGPYAIYNEMLAAQAAAASVATTGTDEFNVALPQAGVTYHWTGDFSTGFTVSRGFRSGGVSFNQLRAQVVPYDPEYTWNYELSFRSQWLDKAVTANANVFYVDWRDQQVTVRHSDNTYDYNTENAGRSTLYGAELELREKIGGGWSLYQNAGYTHTKFDDFVSSTADYTGNEFPQAPHWTLGAGVAYEHARGWFGTASATYITDAYAGAENAADLRLGSRRLVNAKLGYAARRWSAYVFGTNLLDDDYFVVKWRENNVARYGATAGATRQVGVGIDCRF